MKDHITWEEYFMELARLTAKRSKDPKTKVGACIVNEKDNRIISLGYNGFPYGCSDDEFPWVKSDGIDNKKLYVVHAELNAILSAKVNMAGMTMYATHRPCNECMKAIIQAGIKKVIYDNDYKSEDIIGIAVNRMAKAAGVELIKYS